jgi:tetratricopeptide (TPR) repeat protein
MPHTTTPDRADRIATGLLAGVLLVAPLVHAPSLADPFALPQRILILVVAAIAGALAIAGRRADAGAAAIRSPALRLSTLLLVGAALATLVSANRGLALGGLLELAAGVAIFRVGTWVLSTERAVARVLLAATAGAALVAAGAIAQVLFGAHLTLGPVSLLPALRGGSTLGDPGLVAQHLVIALPIGIGSAALQRGAARVAGGALVGLIVSALLIIGRPEGWIAGLWVAGLIGATRLVVLWRRREGWRGLIPEPGGEGLRATIAAGVILLAVIALSRLPAARPAPGTGLLLHGTTLLVPTSGDPAVDRAAAVPATLRLAARHPLGVGPDNFRHAFLEVAWTGGASPFTLSHQAIHTGNSFVESIAETGVLGGLAFIALAIALGLQAWLAATRAPGAWGVAGFALLNATLALTIAACFGAPFQEPAPMLLLWTMAAAIQSAALAAPDTPGPIGRLQPAAVAGPPLRPRRRFAATAALILWIVGGGAAIATQVNRARGSRLALIGQAAFQAGNYEAAIQALQQPAVRRLPDHLPRVLAANAYWRLGFLDRAAEEFGAALDRSPFFPGALIGRAAVRQTQGRYDLAEIDLRSALKVWPRNSDMLLAYARLNVQRGRFDDAIEQLRVIAERDPSLAEPYALLGDLFMRRGQLDEAIEAYRMCGAKNPRYPGLHLKTGDAFFRKGLHEMALRAYQAAAAIDTAAVEPRLRIANTQHALGSFCDALESLQGARDLETDAARRGTILDLIARIEPDCRRARSGR